jgi:protein involved in polysaccharide export with SLBB domain
MKALPFSVGAVILLAGCSGPSASFRRVPEGFYRVEGIVHQPGLVKCGGSEKTLMTVIKDAGGFTIESYLNKIRVTYPGSTNYFNARKILNHESEDPLLPCGSTIQVSDNMF